MSLNLLIRQRIPSISRLTYNPAFARGLDALDLPPRLMFREFRGLPPNHMRSRVGVGNRILANQALHQAIGVNFWFHAFANAWCNWQSDIVELGVGCGRQAFHIRDLRFQTERFRGSYLGVDIDEEMLGWCRDHFDQRFQFVNSGHSSTSYVNQAPANAYYRIPRQDASIDLIHGSSVFSHLLEPEMQNYLEESARIAKPGGVLAVTFFCKDRPGKSLGDRHSFRHRVGNAFVESLEQPQAAVAYEADFITSHARNCGFAEASVVHDPSAVQQRLVCRR